MLLFRVCLVGGRNGKKERGRELVDEFWECWLSGRKDFSGEEVR